MKKTIFVWTVAVLLLILNGSNAFSGDLTCYGYTSATSHFTCGDHGNCVWWAAYMRPDIAAVISGSGWDGNQWYGNLDSEGFDVGYTPKVGAIAAFSNGQNGHVAYIESLDGNGSFGVSEMDYYGTLGDGSGVQYATYSPNGSTYKRNGSGSWTLQGFIYRRQSGTNLYCDSISSIWGICWTPSSTDVSCQGGTDWTLYAFEQGSVINVSTNQYCLETGGVGGGGASGSTILPDFAIKKIWLSDSSGNPKTVFTPGQAMQIHAEIKNNGIDTSSGIYAKYYRSNGYKRDSNPTELATDFINKDDLQGGETHNELKNTTAPTTLGTYNMTVKADSGGDVIEEHEGNNWSDEAVFSVVNTVIPFKFLPFMNSILE